MDDVDNSVYKLSPVALTVQRGTGAVLIDWATAPDATFLQVVRPLVEIGEAVLALENKRRPEAAPPAPGQGKSSSKDS